MLRNTPVLETEENQKTRKCPKCGCDLYYKSKNIYRAIKLNSLCKSCSKKGKSNPFYGKSYLDPKLLSDRMKGNKYNLGKYRTYEQKEIHSMKLKQFCQTPKGKECIRKRTENIRRTRALLGTKEYHPNFNKTACKFFDYLNKELGWSGIHALNGGEYYIQQTGNWVDYYEPKLNIVIEWDEKFRHYENGKLSLKDILREQKIKTILKCKFIRLEQTEDYVTAKNIILSHCKK